MVEIRVAVKSENRLTRSIWGGRGRGRGRGRGVSYTECTLIQSNSGVIGWVDV